MDIHGGVVVQQAGEIERLKAEIERLKASPSEQEAYAVIITDLEAEVERLRAVLRRIQEELPSAEGVVRWANEALKGCE